MRALNEVSRVPNVMMTKDPLLVRDPCNGCCYVSDINDVGLNLKPLLPSPHIVVIIMHSTKILPHHHVQWTGKAENQILWCGWLSSFDIR